MNGEHQEDKVTRGDVRRFIQRRRGLYPSGVSESLLTEEPPPVVSAPSPVRCIPLDGESLEKVLVLFVVPQVVSVETGDLLRSAVEKGMKLSLALVAVSEVIPDNERVRTFSSLKAIVWCGVPSKGREEDSVFQCDTHSIEEVFTDVTKKRDFWNILKSVMGKIGKEELVA